MRANQAIEPDHIEDGVVQLRFADDDGEVRDIIAADMIEVIQGLVEFTSDMAKKGLFGDGHEPEVRVRPPKEGSLIIEAVLTWIGENPTASVGLGTTAGGFLGQGIRIAFRKLRGEEPSDFERQSNGLVKIKWPGNQVDEVPGPVWDQLNAMKPRTRRSLRKLLAPLSGEADSLEVRDGQISESTSDVLQSEPEAVATTADYRIAVIEPDDTAEESRTFETEARLQSIDFRPGEKWRVETVSGTRLANMEDQDFLVKIDQGAALHKDDIFQLEIRELRTTKNERTVTEWSITRVISRRRGGDDGNSSQPDEANS